MTAPPVVKVRNVEGIDVITGFVVDFERWGESVNSKVEFVVASHPISGSPVHLKMGALS